MILTRSHVSKAFGTDVIIEDISSHIEDQEKAAIVGINGAGKSTLLKVIVGELVADEGSVVLSKGKTMGYLAQHQDLTSHKTIFEEPLEVKRDVLLMEEYIRILEVEMKHAEGKELEEMLSTYTRLSHEFELAGGYACQSEVTGALKGLGFAEEDLTKQIHTLSGGQKTRVSLGKLLLSKPDITLLDELTNHLDMESIAWLETYLPNYKGVVIIVAHDRYFLDRVAGKIIELDNGHGTVSLGNYSAYSEKKAMLRDAQLKAYLNQQQEIRHQEEVIAKLKSLNREKSIKRAESREKMLSKIEVLDKPVEVNDEMHIRLEPNITSGNDVLTVRNLGKSFGSNHLFSHADMDIKRGERVAVIGNNGTGKTMLLKIINDMLPVDPGEIVLGSKVHIGYYDQEHQVLYMEKTLFDELQDTYPDMNNTKIRNVLAAFLFTGDDVFKRIGDLSGGERGRVSLAKLMLSNANSLILDEPINHLDITSKEISEQALNQYTGTVLYVSHDRYLINKTATRILELTGETFINYIGNYDYYLEKKDLMNQLYVAPSGDDAVSQDSGVPEVKQDWKAQKEEQARLHKRQNDLKKVEDETGVLEERDAVIDELLLQLDICSDVAWLMELHQEKERIAERLTELYELWESLAEQPPHSHRYTASTTKNKEKPATNKKRIIAIVVLVLIALLYLATIIFVIIDSPLARSCLMAALFCTIVLPVIAYAYLKLIENLKEHKDSEEEIEYRNK